MGEAAHKRREVSALAREFGETLAERIIGELGLTITPAQGDATADVVRETILSGVTRMWERGMPAELAALWGREALSALQRRLREHIALLDLTCLLDNIDPSEATRQ